MADVKLNSLATKTNANAAAILVKDSATQNAGAEGWITKAQLNQIIRDEIKAQMSAITSGTPDVPVLDGSTLKYMTLANFAKVAGGQGGVYDGIFIMYHRKSDNNPVLANLDGWSSLQNAGEIADGVGIINGCKILVVAPTGATSSLNWSSAAVSGGATTTTDRLVAMDDWAGRANTTSILNHSTSSAITNTSSYAPGYCNNYSRVNANGSGLTAGKWWLPSLGEMMMIYANMIKVNYALSLISGATQLEKTWYWTSTEYGEPSAWFLSTSDGYLRYGPKANTTFSVRAVSTFIA